MLRFYFAMLSDDDARRAEDLARGLRDPAARHCIRALLHDRRERIALELEIARKVAHLRQRLVQAARYFNGLLEEAQGVANRPWPKRVTCPSCGAPSLRVLAEPTPQPGAGGSHRLIHVHEDGRRCPEAGRGGI
jgi:hypothetical protein